MATKREELSEKAKIFGDMERFEEMCQTMEEVVDMSDETELDVDERNLLCAAYKNLINPQRASWRILNDIAARHSSNSKLAEVCQMFLMQVESELEQLCERFFVGIQKLVNLSKTTECKIFAYKMLGDYKRYLAECCPQEKRDMIANDSLCAYKTAVDLAEELPALNALRLGLSLNLSVFYYEILNNPEMACKTAQDAFAEAMEGKERSGDVVDTDCRAILSLLRDNINLWTMEVGEDDDV